MKLILFLLILLVSKCQGIIHQGFSLTSAIVRQNFQMSETFLTWLDTLSDCHFGFVYIDFYCCSLFTFDANLYLVRRPMIG